MSYINFSVHGHITKFIRETVLTVIGSPLMPATIIGEKTQIISNCFYVSNYGVE